MDEQLLSNLIAFLGSFSTPLRMRIAAAIVETPKTVEELSDELDTPAMQIFKQLDRLRALGYVYRTHIDGTYAFDLTALQGLIKASYRMPLPAPPADKREKALRSFLREGKLIHIPSQLSKRMFVLEEIANEFETGRDYTEKEVNEKLLPFFDDYCTLRRALIDHGFLSRTNGIYSRVKTKVKVTG